MRKVLFFGTHPKQFNGYSKVVYELAQCLVNYDDIELMIYGFQNFYHNPKHRTDIDPRIKIYDVFANENPKGKGFGVKEVNDVVKLYDPDVCIIYNDMVVVSSLVSELRKIPNPKFKIIGYIDQVYLNQKKMFIEFINKNIDVSMLFTKSWETCIKEQGVKTPTCYLPHGINPQTFYPVPKFLARKFFNLSMDDFIILNLNRNQPRKRWDICLKAFAEIVSRYPDSPIKMIIGTSLQGEWNLVELFERELEKRNMTLEQGIKHLIVLDNPQKNTDEETNVLYNVADVGINTCDGEGFGLCNFEQAAVGIPQVVPRLGGFMDFFDDDCAMMCDPQMAYYVGSSKEFVGGEALLVSYMDVADHIETYYLDKGLREKHGKLLREKILREYQWKDITKKLHSIIVDTLKDTPKEAAEITEEVKNLVKDVEAVDENTTQNINAKPANPSVTISTPVSPVATGNNRNAISAPPSTPISSTSSATEKIDTETLDKLVAQTKSDKNEKNDKSDKNDNNGKKDKNKSKTKTKKKSKKKNMNKEPVSREEVVALQKVLAEMLNRVNEAEDSESSSSSSSKDSSSSDSNSDDE